MITILGKQYLTDKEASERYGYSQSWFIRGRVQKYGPAYKQLIPRGRILYPLDETDEWFKEKTKDE